MDSNLIIFKPLNKKLKLFNILILLRAFFNKIIYNIELVYDFNLLINDIFINVTNVKFFWTLVTVLNKSILFNYSQLNDITCIDNLVLLKNNQDNNKNRFTLIYIFTNIKFNARIILRLIINKNQRIPSLCNLYSCANWLEREIYDLFGVVFLNHPDLRRILTDYGFMNNPLLKDFPLTGYIELRYNESLKCVEYQPVKLMQEYRFFNFESPWNQYLVKTHLEI
jgi:NADH-quinone oxidoreductase subunit C